MLGSILGQKNASKARIAAVVMTSLMSCCVWADGYLGARAGMVSVDDDSAGLNFSDRALSGGVYGGINLSERIALELSYLSSGILEEDFGVVSVEAKYSGGTLVAVGRLPTSASGNSSIFGKVGFYVGEVDVSLGSLSGGDSDSGFTAGIGADMELTETITLRGDLDWFEGDAGLTTLTVGIQFAVGK